MQTILEWVPAAGGGSQTIQYKIHANSTWTTAATVPATATSANINSLNYNTIYDYQVVNNCPNSSTAVLSGTNIIFQCPTLTINPSSTTAVVQFFDLGGSVDTYKVDLLDPSGVTILQTHTLVAPFSAQVSTTFSGLVALSGYTVRVTPKASTFSKTDCGATAFSTTNTPACPMPASLNVTFADANPTTATFSWIAQSGIMAQEVWFGRTSVIGSTLPPAAGWNPGANLYSATANNATLAALDVNTQYSFAVRSLCSTGNSNWNIITGEQFFCSTPLATPHSTSVDVSIPVFNPQELANITDHLTLFLKDNNNNAISNIVYAGSAITNPIIANFQGLTPNTIYNLVFTIAVAGSGNVDNVCATTSFTTTAVATCPQLTFSVSGITGTSFTVTPTTVQAGETYDVSVDNGVTWIVTSGNLPSQNVTGLTIGQTYQVVLRHHCANSTTSLSASQVVATQNANFSVVDVWYSCGSQHCNGRAIYANWVEIRRVSDNVLIYRYDTTGATASFSTYVAGVVQGTAYSLTSNWTVDRTKTNGVSNLTLKGNSTQQSWSPTTGTIIQQSISFTGGTTNDIEITAASLGPICAC